MSMKPNPEDCQIIAGKVEILLRNGSHYQAIRVVEQFVASIKEPGCPFDGYDDPNDLPLAMTDLSVEIIDSLSGLRMVTIGDVVSSTDVQMRAAYRIGVHQVVEIRNAVERLRSAFYRAKTKR